jgi:hypothetical protein
MLDLATARRVSVLLNPTRRELAIAHAGSDRVADLLIARGNARFIRQCMVREARAGNQSNLASYRARHKECVRLIGECLG